MKCLLVDDEPGIRDGLAILLRRRGIEVHTAADLQSAMALLTDHRFQAVVTDWCLPDGTAQNLLSMIKCPVVVVSGHPEEVLEDPSITAVLAKPVMPADLVQLLSEISVVSTPKAGVEGPPQGVEQLPVDVRDAVAQARDLLSQDSVRIHDDGVFVVLQARWPGEHIRSELQELGGDMRILADGEGARFELRWFRDGRPDSSLPLVLATDPWPEVSEICVDFHDIPMTADDFGRCVRRAVEYRAAGRCVHFLNVLPELRDAIESSGQGADLPMRERIGPRIPTDLNELWS